MPQPRQQNARKTNDQRAPVHSSRNPREKKNVVRVIEQIRVWELQQKQHMPVEENRTINESANDRWMDDNVCRETYLYSAVTRKGKTTEIKRMNYRSAWRI